MKLEERLFCIFAAPVCGIRLPSKTVNFVPRKFDLANNNKRFNEIMFRFNTSPYLNIYKSHNLMLTT